jgi:crotonobetainyl-CoA:carnitine CoA-transferase CaiB-like acyl-CoA transferase
VARLEELADDPQLEAAGILPETRDAGGRAVRTVASPIAVEGAPRAELRPAPAVGEHTDQVLAALGYDDRARAALRARGAIR